MKNFENPGLAREEEGLSDEALLGVKNGGKKNRRIFSREDGFDPDEDPSRFTSNSLADALNKLNIPTEPTPELAPEKPKTVPAPEKPKPAPAKRQEKPAVETRENPIKILEGIKDVDTVAKILNLVRKAFVNETTDDAKSRYTLVLDTLEKIDKKINNGQGAEIDIKLVERLPEIYDLKNTVKKILGLDKEPVHNQTEKGGEDIATEERPEQTTGKAEKAEDPKELKPEEAGYEVGVVEEEAEERKVLDEDKIIALKTAFETSGFLEFLAQNPNEAMDIENPNNAETVLKIHDAYVIKGEVSAGLKSVATEVLSGMIGVDDPEMVASLDVYLNSQAYENPEKLADYKSKLDTANTQQAEIASLEKQLAERTAELPLEKITTAEEADLAIINTPIDAGFFGPAGRKILHQFAETGKMLEVTGPDSQQNTGWQNLYRGVTIGTKLFFVDLPYSLYQLTRINSDENNQLREEARLKIEKITNERYSRKSVGKFLEKMAEQKEKSAEITRLNKEINGSTAAYGVYKRVIGSELIRQGDIAKDAGRRIKGTIGKILTEKNFDFSKTEKAQDLLMKVQDAMDNNEDLAFLSPEEITELQEVIDKKAQEIVLSQIKKIFDANKKANSPFSKIETSLKGILDRNKIGSQEGDNIRKIMKESLVKVAESYKDPVVTTKIKAFILVNKL
ncbi:MAG: hypothetical protein WCO10_01665 [bacterium]